MPNIVLRTARFAPWARPTRPFTGVYHICRLREGRDTDIQPESREATLAAALKAGLEIYYCIEPVGPEHDYAELTREIMRARTLDVKYMAAMRRVPVPGTPPWPIRGRFRLWNWPRSRRLSIWLSAPQSA